MALERRSGKMRPTLPRSSDLAIAEAPVDRSAGRDASGRFASRHGLSFTKSWHLRMAEQLGVGMEGSAGELAREAYKSYRAFLRELPATSAGINSLVAQRARASVLAAFLSRSALAAGLSTPEGEKLLSQAATWDARAERLAVTSWDMSTRAAKAAKAQPIDAHARVLEAFGGTDP
jgi:hypothetical protein